MKGNAESILINTPIQYLMATAAGYWGAPLHGTVAENVQNITTPAELPNIVQVNSVCIHTPPSIHHASLLAPVSQLGLRRSMTLLSV